MLRAITVQTDAVRNLQGHSMLTRIAEGSKDADTILETIRNINNLCDVFQVSFIQDRQGIVLYNHLPKIDTELHIEVKVEDIDETVKAISRVLSFFCENCPRLI